MLLSRSTCVLQQCVRRKLLTINTPYSAELQKSYKNVYEYNQTRTYKNFGHTPKKERLHNILPLVIGSAGMIINCFDWTKFIKIPSVDAASIPVEDTHTNENVEIMEQDLQKKKKKKQKIGFRDRKV